MSRTCELVALLTFLFWSSGFFALAQDASCFFGDQSFLPGENLGDAVQTRCGDTTEWPCFCNPDLPDSAECPYCSFSAGDGTLYCAKDGQNITFPDGSISRSCSCEIPDDPAEAPIRNCTVVVSAVGCNWFDINGDPIYFDDGESFGDLIDGACGPAAEWPSFCYVPPGSLGGDDFLIDYPYCIYSDTDSGETLCSKDGETFDYVNSNGTDLSCTCAYSSADGPTTNCERTGSTPPAPSREPTTSPPNESPSTPDEAPSPDVTPAPAPAPQKSGGFSRWHCLISVQSLTHVVIGVWMIFM